MNYLDTSLIVAALTTEPSTHSVRIWLVGQAAGSLLASDWTITEFSSALALKLRSRRVTEAQYATALSNFQRFVARFLHMVPVTAQQFRTAARFVEHHAVELRAADALHLAVASEHNALLVTLDKRLADGGRALGETTQLLM